MALIEAAGGRVWHQPPKTRRASVPVKPQPSWQYAMLELVGTFIVLAGIAAGLLTLRLALVVLPGVQHRAKTKRNELAP